MISLISQFDVFYAALVRVIFYSKPELLNASDKTLLYSQIIEFDSIDEVKDYVIEKEVNVLLRESHEQQIKWLEKKLGIQIIDLLKNWQQFIELTERRNLFVHCDGAVSDQYLNICRKHNVEINPELKIGSNMGVNKKYFEQSYKCIFETGIVLAQTIWRKLFPKDLEEADNNLNNICYNLLIDEEFDLAKRLLDYAASLKKVNSYESKLYFIVNKALAYKLSGDNNSCKKILDEFDWSAFSNLFKLARFVLLDDFDNAATIMRKIGTSGEVTQADYRQWPLFKEFRRTELFLKIYKDIFDQEFEGIKENSTKDVHLFEDTENRETNNKIEENNEILNEVACGEELFGNAI